MQSFLWKVYLYSFFDAFILIGAIYALYFAAHGLNPFQISILIAIWSAVVFMGEVPAGVIADKYSRRNILILASLCRGVGFLIWLLFPNFLGFAIGFIFWGLRNILASGTFEAFIYDELKANGKEQFYEKVSGRTNGYMYIGLMLSTAVGGFLAQNSFSLVLVLSILTSILGAFVLTLIKSVKPLKPTEEIHSFGILKNAISEVTHTKKLFVIISFICLIFGTYVAVDDFWPLIFNSYNYTVAEVGALIAIVYGVAALASYTTHLISFKSKLNSTFILVITGGLVYLLVGLLKMPFLLFIVYLGVYLLKAADIKFEAILQHSISSHQRATISSIKSLSTEIVYMSLVLLFGFVGTHLGLSNVLVIAGILIALTTLIYWKTLSKYIK